MIILIVEEIYTIQTFQKKCNNLFMLEAYLEL